MDEHKINLATAETFLKHHRGAKISVNLTWLILGLATAFAIVDQVVLNYKHIRLNNTIISGIFIAAIVIVVAVTAYYLIIEMKDLKNISDLFSVENARKSVKASDEIQSVTDAGKKFIVRSKSSTLALDKKFTGISVSDDYQHSYYEQEIIYFDKAKFAQNFVGSQIDPTRFLNALPDDYYTSLTNVDQQVNTLYLTEKNYSDLVASGRDFVALPSN
ncbi:MAG: hypothetical protein LKF36_03030 [Lactobacillus sp.]|jgi:hypothetical protein|nr:hypothetical protein [Lactobacillus sp.]